MVASQNEGTQYGPQNTIILLIGHPQKATPDYRKPPFENTMHGPATWHGARHEPSTATLS